MVAILKPHQGEQRGHLFEETHIFAPDAFSTKTSEEISQHYELPLNGGHSGSPVVGVSDFTHTPLHNLDRLPLEARFVAQHAERVFLSSGSLSADKKYGSEQEAANVAAVYRTAALAGLKVPAALARARTVSLERIYGTSLAKFFSDAERMGFTSHPDVRSVIDALTEQNLKDLVIFQQMRLPFSANPCDYAGKLEESISDMLWHCYEALTCHPKPESVGEATNIILGGFGVNKTKFRAELRTIGDVLASNAKYPFMDPDLSNSVLDFGKVTDAMSTIAKVLSRKEDYLETNTVKVLQYLYEGKISKSHALDILLPFYHIDLDRAASELSVGPDDFFRAISSIEGKHPLMENGYAKEKLNSYLRYVRDMMGPGAEAEMRNRFSALGIASQFFLYSRRGGILASRDYQEAVYQLIFGDFQPYSQPFNNLVKMAADVERRILMNFNNAQYAAMAEPAFGAELRSFFGKLLIVPHPNLEELIARNVLATRVESEGCMPNPAYSH